MNGWFVIRIENISSSIIYLHRNSWNFSFKFLLNINIFIKDAIMCKDWKNAVVFIKSSTCYPKINTLRLGSDPVKQDSKPRGSFCENHRLRIFIIFFPLSLLKIIRSHNLVRISLWESFKQRLNVLNEETGNYYV